MRRMYHVMFLPMFGGSIDADFWLNAVTILVFLAVYFWHLKHDHAHGDELLRQNQALLDEVRAIRRHLKD